MIKKGSDIIIQAMIDEGVDTIFGYPGASIIPIYDSMYDRKGEITHYLTADEAGATHAADGYARSSGKVGTVLVSSGPGSTNTVTAIASAYFDSVPIVVFTGQVYRKNIGSDSFQEVDITSIVTPVTKYTHQVKSVEDLQLAIRKAYRIAREGRPGPVLLDLPKDVLVNSCEVKTYEEIIHLDESKKLRHNASVSHDDIEIFSEYINKAQRPLIYAGGGIVMSGTSDILRTLADKAQIPVVNSLMGQGIMDSTSPLSLGHVGMHGHVKSNYAMRNCDLLIALGARFSDRVTLEINEFAKNAKIIQADIDISEIGKIVGLNHFAHADLSMFMPHLLDRVISKDRSDWIKSINETGSFNDDYTQDWTERNIIKAIKAKVGKEAFIATDVGQHQMWVSQYYGFDSPRKFVTSGGLGAMGFGLGAAIGAKVANKDTPVVLITGDGSFRMNMNELATVHKYNLPIIIVVMNNGALGMVRQWQTIFNEKRYAETDITDDVDLVKLAEAFYMKGIRVDNIKDLEAAVSEGISENKYLLIEAMIDKDSLVLPMIPVGGGYEDAILGR